MLDLLLALTMTVTLSSERTDSVQIFLPWTVDEPGILNDWCREQGIDAVAVGVPPWELGGPVLAPDIVLFGYHLPILRTLELDGELEALPNWFAEPQEGEVGERYVADWLLESWAPVYGSEGLPGGLPLKAWDDLFRPEFRGFVHLRMATWQSPESWLLSQLAWNNDLSPANELDQLVLSSSEGGTLHPWDQSIRVLLRDFPFLGISVAPVRQVVKLRREGFGLVYIVPDEGFYAMPAGIAQTRGSDNRCHEVLAKLQDPSARGELLRRLDLESAYPLPVPSPPWVEELVEGRREVLDLDGLATMQHLVAEEFESYAGTSSRFSEPLPGIWENLFDWTWFTMFVVFLLFVLTRMGRARRIRRRTP